MTTRFRSAAGFVAPAVFLLASCSGPSRPATHPVRGMVTFQKRPAAQAVVVLRPVAAGTSFPPPTGTVEPDGAVVIGTFAAGDGAPVGEYIVTITWNQTKTDANGDAQTTDRLGGRFADPAKSPWRVVVREGENVLEPFWLD